MHNNDSLNHSGPNKAWCLQKASGAGAIYEHFPNPIAAAHADAGGW